MTPQWPSFWASIPDDDRAALRDIPAELLTTGVLLGESGRERELFLTARKYEPQISEYLAPLNLNLFPDPDRPLFQARPIPGECGLIARFTKDETLVVLTLWRLYDDARMERPAETIIVSANDLYSRLKLYFEHIEPPTNTHLERIVSKLRSKRLIRFQKNEQHFGESRIEILPTLARAIPFERVEEWTQTVNGFKQGTNGEEETGSSTDNRAST
jgi:hypothetical protein